MKYFIGFVGLVLLSVFLVGCPDAGKTYSVTEEGMCMEITTSDADLQSEIESAGFEEGACPGDETASCSGIDPGEMDDSIDWGDTEMTIYVYDDNDALGLAFMCTGLGGTLSN